MEGEVVTETKKPNPGSPEAKAQGCRCPVVDNNQGQGYMGMIGVFVRRPDCPLHGWKDD